MTRLLRTAGLLGSIGVAVACTGDAAGAGVDAGACGTSAPVFPACVAHGLAGIDLAGTWTFTGTETTYTYQPPAPTQTVPTTRSITFTTDGCTFQIAGGFSIAVSHLDDSNAIAPDVFDRDAHGPIEMCSPGDGTILFHDQLGYDRRARGGSNGAVEDEGVLTR